MVGRVGKIYSLPESRRIFATQREAREKRFAATWMRGYVAGLTTGLVIAIVAVPTIAWIITR